MPYLYTQCITAITIPSGDYKNSTFVVAAYQSGLSVGQFSPNPTPPNYTLGGVSNIDNNGGSTLAIEFLLDYSNTDYPSPYYFVYGSGAGYIWLNSITPATEGNPFTSSNVKTQIASEKLPNTPEIAGLFYYAPQGYLYVATSETPAIANLYWYSVTWSNGVPSLSYVGSNTSYYGDACEPVVTLTFFPAGTLTDYDCLLLGGIGAATGVIFNAKNPSSTPSLYGYLNVNSPPAVTPSAVCRGRNGLYFATMAGGLHYQPYSGFDASLSPIWTVPSGHLIISLAYSPNAGNSDLGNYPEGAIIIGTTTSSPCDNLNSEPLNSNSGSIWVCDVSNNTVGNAPQQYNTISGPAWGIIADANLNYMCAIGSCGVFLSTLAPYNPQSNIPENGLLVPNIVSTWCPSYLDW